MNVEERLKRLEDKFAMLEAIVDGSEEQTREATAYVVGIVTRFLHEKGLIDESVLMNYINSFEGDSSDREDYMGQMVRRLGAMIDFHERYPGDFYPPASGKARG